MSVYVDELFATKPTANWRYPAACHMVADTDEELHEFAGWLGLKLSWAQHMDRPNQYSHHYDLTASKRLHAVKLGAIEITWRQMGEMIIEEHERRDEPI